MKVRGLSILTAGALILAVAGLMAPGASASRAPRLSHHGMAPAQPHSRAGTIYSQNDNDAAIGVTSQNFETSFDAYDNSGADDFKLTKKHAVSEVDVTGVYFNCYTCGPAVSESVTFYKNAGGLPGSVVKSATATGTDDAGSFAIKIKKVKLKPGTYWVGVVANMDFNTGGQWGWETRSVQSGSPGAWENPGDGFGTGCTSWGVQTTCLAQGAGPDYMFALLGS